MINYFLKRIALLGLANKFSAQIKTNSSLNVDDIIAEMESQGSTVGKADILSVLHSFHVAITKLLQRGHAITTPIANYKPGIKGVFENADDRFDRSRHKLKVNISPGKMVVDALRTTPVEKIKATYLEPEITSYFDSKSKTDQTVTPGGIGTVKGSLLNFNEEATDEGIWFHNGASSAKVQIVAKNKPGELIFMNPDSLTKGKYHVEVRNRSKSGKNLRTYYFDTELQVK